jgi:hypothetical protein
MAVRCRVARSTPAEALPPRDVLLEFGQWLANSPGRIYDLQDTIDSGNGDDFAALVDMYLSPHNREADHE